MQAQNERGRFMNAIADYNIVFSGLKRGSHKFTFRIDDKFFGIFGYGEMNNADFNVDLQFVKFQNFMELHFDIEGHTDLICDVSNEEYTENIRTGLDLVIKFGEKYNDDHEEILVLPYDAFEINVAQYIYEAIVLALPLKRIHPGVRDGSLQTETLDLLHKYRIRKPEGHDPRWDSLNELKKNNHGTS